MAGNLYLIRHGQAGLRDNYDTLSELGQQQAALLGEHLAESQIQFSHIIAGGLRRQQATAQAVAGAFAAAGRTPPPIHTDEQWNEFDLDQLFAEYAPPLREEDERFRREHDEILASMGNPDDRLHREHHYCDIEVIRAWVTGRFAYSGESWQAFRGRILRAAESLRDIAHEPVAVFTSATPVAVGAAEVLGVDDMRLWRLAGVTYNTSISTFAHELDGLRLVSFNAVPHLPDPAHWTRRRTPDPRRRRVRWLARPWWRRP